MLVNRPPPFFPFSFLSCSRVLLFFSPLLGEGEDCRNRENRIKRDLIWSFPLKLKILSLLASNSWKNGGLISWIFHPSSVNGFIKFTLLARLVFLEILPSPFQITEMIRDFFFLCITNRRKIRVLNFIFSKKTFEKLCSSFSWRGREGSSGAEFISFIFKENSQRFNIISLFL